MIGDIYNFRNKDMLLLTEQGWYLGDLSTDMLLLTQQKTIKKVFLPEQQTQ